MTEAAQETSTGVERVLACATDLEGLAAELQSLGAPVIQSTERDRGPTRAPRCPVNSRAPAVDLLARDFAAQAPGQRLVGDSRLSPPRAAGVVDHVESGVLDT